MKVSLERVDARGLRVDFPGTGGESIAIASAIGLVGTLEHAGERLSLSDVAADRVELDALRLLLSGLLLSTESAVVLTGPTLALEQTSSSLSVDVAAAEVAVVDLNVTVDDVVVRGKATLGRARLSLRGDEGTLAAEHVDLAGFLLRIGDLELTAEALVGASVEIAWGAKGFRLHASRIVGPALLVTSKEDARIDAREVALGALVVADGGLTLGTLTASTAQCSFALAPAAPAEPAAPASAGDSAAAPLFDWRVFDGLSGDLDVDVVLDVTVPIIGHRKATHRFRIPVADGALDYRALERNLAKLEDALLDFSVREGMLVLERVNPLYPVRGHGKPVVVWEVDVLDHELAERERVRLAVLPRARLFEGESTSDEPSSIALRELALLHINARLALAAIERPLAGPLEGQLRPHHIGSVVLAGNIYHEPGAAPRGGSLVGELTDLRLGIVGLSVGTNHLDVTSLATAAILPVEIAFAGASPTSISLGISGLGLEGAKLRA